MTGTGNRRVPSVTAIRGAVRHSRIVRTMRVILPALALLVIGVVTLQAFMYRADDSLKLSFANAESLADDLKMLHPELSASLDAGSPFDIRADWAMRDGKTLQLKNIEANFNFADKSRFSLRAPEGVLKTDSAQIVLGGGLALVSNRGYELHTESAVFDTRAGKVTGQDEVSWRGPAGTARADRFAILEKGERIRLRGNVRFTFVPHTPPSG